MQWALMEVELHLAEQPGMYLSLHRRCALAVLLTAICLCTAQAATLEQLTLDQMAEKATTVVRATVTGSSTSVVNATVYTHYKLRIAEKWKGPELAEVMVPGGQAGKFQQSFPGVPELKEGKEYVLFLWKSSVGIVHLLGLSQGVFELSAPAEGSSLATRAKIGEMMLDAAGKKVADRAVSISLSDLRARVLSVAGTGVGK
jgi:hypothetical protein